MQVDIPRTDALIGAIVGVDPPSLATLDPDMLSIALLPSTIALMGHGDVTVDRVEILFTELLLNRRQNHTCHVFLTQYTGIHVQACLSVSPGRACIV